MAEWGDREKVAILEHRPEYGGLHLIGVRRYRKCGCEAELGMRLDREETTFGARPCSAHMEANGRAMQTFKTMRPSDERIWDAWERILEPEIARG